MVLEAFQFKQFSVAHDRCAMKVGTDAVLLGTWAPVNPTTKSILDIGAGSGILALILAQRSNANLIDGLEIDVEAYEQCVTNFEESPWADRLFCYHASLQEFAEEIEDKYDLIVSNPPFYTNQFDTKNNARNLARFENALPFDHLIKSAKMLLSTNGVFCVILPYSEEFSFCKLANEKRLYCNEKLRVCGQKNGEIKRSLMVFSHQKQTTKTQEMFLEDGRHNYSNTYKEIAKEFYLKF